MAEPTTWTSVPDAVRKLRAALPDREWTADERAAVLIVLGKCVEESEELHRPLRDAGPLRPIESAEGLRWALDARAALAERPDGALLDPNMTDAFARQQLVAEQGFLSARLQALPASAWLTRRGLESRLREVEGRLGQSPAALPEKRAGST